MKLLSILLFSLSVLFIAPKCSNTPSSSQDNQFVTRPQVERDLADIREDGVLKAITVYSSTSYFLYRGQPMGFEYELLKRLADHLDLKLEIVVAQDLDELISMLNRGEGDLISHGLTITQERKTYVDFTDYLYLTRQVLVQRKPDNWRQLPGHKLQQALIQDPIELIGDTVAVRQQSSYLDRIHNLEEELGGQIHVDTVGGDVPTGKIIKQVVDGRYDYTVADRNIAAINASYYPQLDISTPISFSQRIAWAVRSNSPDLRAAVNQWVSNMKDQVDYYVIYNKYFKNKRRFRARVKSEFYSKSTGKISPYDELIRSFGDTTVFDWRFLASLIYQESKFEPKATSWVGAQGLMQLMPATARSLGVTDRTDPEQSLRGGIRYLQQMWEYWENIPDSTTRLKFAIASYNCGYNHVADARRLADKYGDDPDQWEGHVEQYLQKLTYSKYYNDPVAKYGYVRGIEPVTYVKQVFARFEHYRQLVSSGEETSQNA